MVHQSSGRTPPNRGIGQDRATTPSVGQPLSTPDNLIPALHDVNVIGSRDRRYLALYVKELHAESVMGNTGVDFSEVDQHIIPESDNTYDLGATSSYWREAFLAKITSGHIAPVLSNTFDLGTPSLRFRNLYVDEIHVPSQTSTVITWDATVSKLANSDTLFFSRPLADQPELPAEWITGDVTAYIVELIIWNLSGMSIALNTSRVSVTPGASLSGYTTSFKDDIRQAIQIELSAGSHTVSFTGIPDTTAPYFFNLSSSEQTDLGALRDSLSNGDSVTITLTVGSGVTPTPVTPVVAGDHFSTTFEAAQDIQAGTAVALNSRGRAVRASVAGGHETKIIGIAKAPSGSGTTTLSGEDVDVVISGVALARITGSVSVGDWLVLSDTIGVLERLMPVEVHSHKHDIEHEHISTHEHELGDTATIATHDHSMNGSYTIPAHSHAINGLNHRHAHNHIHTVSGGGHAHRQTSGGNTAPSTPTGYGVTGASVTDSSPTDGAQSPTAPNTARTGNFSGRTGASGAQVTTEGDEPTVEETAARSGLPIAKDTDPGTPIKDTPNTRTATGRLVAKVIATSNEGGLRKVILALG